MPSLLVESHDEIQLDAASALSIASGAVPPYDSLSTATCEQEALVAERVASFLSERREIGPAPMLRLGSSDPPWELYDLFTDHLGSVRVVFNNSEGTIKSEHEYLPFGEEAIPYQSYNTHRFTGHERDAGTGLDVMLQRHFSAGLGRFVSADFVGGDSGRPQSYNKYAYTWNNPLILIDPSGLWPDYPFRTHESALIMAPPTSVPKSMADWVIAAAVWKSEQEATSRARGSLKGLAAARLREVLQTIIIDAMAHGEALEDRNPKTGELYGVYGKLSVEVPVAGFLKAGEHWYYETPSGHRWLWREERDGDKWVNMVYIRSGTDDYGNPTPASPRSCADCEVDDDVEGEDGGSKYVPQGPGVWWWRGPFPLGPDGSCVPGGGLPRPSTPDPHDVFLRGSK